MNLQKVIYEGWTVQDFINELEQLVEMAVSDFNTVKTKEQLKEFCKDNQPYYKKHIPEVVNYFAQKYNLK
jgi:hypothetical protein